jgi:L-asparagine transporter-like permease
MSPRVYRSTTPLTLASSIGGVIGTCLFFGAAASLGDAGPLGILLAYLFIGTICFATMVSSCLHQSQAAIVLPLLTGLSR